MLTAARRLLKMPLTCLLGWPAFRRRAVYEIRHRYFDELSSVVPLGHGFGCPLTFAEGWHSFGEIFVQGEYDDAFRQMPLPSRWLDIGCHAGFFSLFVAWQRARAGCRASAAALLIDADSRMAAPVAELLRLNGLTDRFQFAHAMIAAGNGARQFRQREVMASSAAEIGSGNGHDTSVPVIGAADILARFPAPYDLVKIDIEGGEYDFVTTYGPVLKATPRVLLEWHSWHSGGGGAAQIRDEMERQGFHLTYSSKEQSSAAASGETTGLMLFAKSQAADGNR